MRDDGVSDAGIWIIAAMIGVGCSIESGRLISRRLNLASDCSIKA